MIFINISYLNVWQNKNIYTLILNAETLISVPLLLNKYKSIFIIVSLMMIKR